MKFRRKILLAFIALALLSGRFPPSIHADTAPYEARTGLVQVGGFVIFFNSNGPLSFQTLTGSEIPGDAADAGQVMCKSCQHGVSVPIPGLGSQRGTSVSGAGGDGGFDKALANLKKERPDLRGIYDVKVDMHQVSVLGIYRKLCTEVSARGFK